jgi:hypothetical protein
MADINAGDGDVWDDDRDAASTGEVKEDTAGGQPSQADLDLAAEANSEFGGQPSQADLDLAAEANSEFGGQPSQADLDLAAEANPDILPNDAYMDANPDQGGTVDAGDGGLGALASAMGPTEANVSDILPTDAYMDSALGSAMDGAMDQGGGTPVSAPHADDAGGIADAGALVDDVDPSAGMG